MTKVYVTNVKVYYNEYITHKLPKSSLNINEIVLALKFISL